MLSKGKFFDVILLVGVLKRYENTFAKIDCINFHRECVERVNILLECLIFKIIFQSSLSIEQNMLMNLILQQNLRFN